MRRVGKASRRANAGRIACPPFVAPETEMRRRAFAHPTPGHECCWRIPAGAPTLGSRGCAARQEPYIPGALSILPGTVPGQVRGPGHMVPTYFRRELRDRALQRRSRLRAFVFD